MRAILINYFRTIVLIFLLICLLTPLLICTCKNDKTNVQVSNTSRNNYIPYDNLRNASSYWNTAWSGRSSQLYDEMLVLTTSYSQNNNYVFGESDCNDMAVDAWQKLVVKEIISLIVVGNLEKSNETFLECNHAWLMVYSGEGSAAAMDLVCGKVVIWENVRANPQLSQYWEGFVYENPSDLLLDFSDRW